MAFVQPKECVTTYMQASGNLSATPVSSLPAHQLGQAVNAIEKVGNSLDLKRCSISVEASDTDATIWVGIQGISNKHLGKVKLACTIPSSCTVEAGNPDGHEGSVRIQQGNLDKEDRKKHEPSPCKQLDSTAPPIAPLSTRYDRAISRTTISDLRGHNAELRQAMEEQGWLFNVEKGEWMSRHADLTRRFETLQDAHTDLEQVESHLRRNMVVLRKGKAAHKTALESATWYSERLGQDHAEKEREAFLLRIKLQQQRAAFREQAATLAAVRARYASLMSDTVSRHTLQNLRLGWQHSKESLRDRTDAINSENHQLRQDIDRLQENLSHAKKEKENAEDLQTMDQRRCEELHQEVAELQASTDTFRYRYQEAVAGCKCGAAGLVP